MNAPDGNRADEPTEDAPKPRFVVGEGTIGDGRFVTEPTPAPAQGNPEQEG